jgi:ABC-type proline/glycine betaine transport system permease subunit
VSAATVVLAVATALVGLGALGIFVRDVTLNARPRVRTVVEAAVPLAGVAVLLWWSWRAL